MAIYPIRTFGDPVLRTPTALVQEIDDGIQRLVADLIDTMYDAPGVGLAAPQIGVSKRVAVFDAQDGTGAHVLINPVLEETSDAFEFDEGCLSIPGHYWTVTRPAFARATALDLDGKPVEYAGDGLLGRVLQHEIDHLDGRLLVDRLGPLARRRALRDLRDEALGLVEYE
ncbi:MAG: peptide deformylase [Acidimicrobiia bacterium]|jgi:peptide deformylase